MKNKTPVPAFAPPAPAGPANFYVTNRAYNLRMRDLYYEEVEKNLVAFSESVKANFLRPDYSRLASFSESVRTASRYAQHAVFGLSPRSPRQSGQAPSSSPAPLHEEFLFIHLLEELYSSGLFLINRFNTIREFKKYKDHINTLPKSRASATGYISTILNFIQESEKAEEEEIRHLISLKIKRIRLANRIFVILKNMENRLEAG